jgi:hypothetical protein
MIASFNVCPLLLPHGYVKRHFLSPPLFISYVHPTFCSAHPTNIHHNTHELCTMLFSGKKKQEKNMEGVGIFKYQSTHIYEFVRARFNSYTTKIRHSSLTYCSNGQTAHAYYPIATVVAVATGGTSPSLLCHSTNGSVDISKTY